MHSACATAHWAGVAYHKRSWLSTALCSKSDGIIRADRDSVQSIHYGKWMISAHPFAWFRLGQFYYYDSTQKLKVSKHDKVHFSPVCTGPTQYRLFFVRFAGNSFHPKWPKLISLRPKLISPRPKLISPNTKNSFSKARNSFPETETLKFSQFCVFCLQKWHGKCQKVLYSTLYLLIFIHSNKKVKIYVKRTHQRVRNSFQKG